MFLLFAVFSCFAAAATTDTYGVLMEHSKITLAGIVLDDSGPVINVPIYLDDGHGGDTTQNPATTTDGNGEFKFTSLSRRNVVLVIDTSSSSPVYLDETVPVKLALDFSVKKVVLAPIQLFKLNTNESRFFFGGDTSFGRRFVMPKNRDHVAVSERYNEYTDVADAFIKASAPLPGAKDTLHWMKPFCKAADFCVVNFETAVTARLNTPHLPKDFVYHSQAATVDALKDFGASYVGLGNNHVYDYLEIGLNDTLAELKSKNIPFSGAGVDPEAALKPYNFTLNQEKYSIFSASSINGLRHGAQWSYDAAYSDWKLTGSTTRGLDKGGAASLGRDGLDLFKKRLSESKADGFNPIAITHVGTEYALSPSDWASKVFTEVADEGPVVIIGHHPHTAQGVGWAGTHSDVVALHSLGNFNFDQDRLDTFLSVHARVDIEGSTVNRVRLIPQYNEDYRGRIFTGYGADNFLRRLAESSQQAAKGTTKKLFVYPYNGQLMVALDESTGGQDEYESSDRVVNFDVTIDGSGLAVVDLRGYLAEGKGESVHTVTSPTSTNAKARFGRDILDFGSFEDDDVDDEEYEKTRWDSYLSITASDPYRGAHAACLQRTRYSTSTSIWAFRNRARFIDDALYPTAPLPNRDVTLFTYMKGKNVNTTETNLRVRHYASFGPNVFSTEDISTPTGDFSWKAFHFDLSPDSETTRASYLEGPRAMRLFMRLRPMQDKTSTLCFDEMAIVHWDAQTSEFDLNATTPQVFPTPHRKDFMQVSGTSGDVVNVQVTLRSYAPKLPAYTPPTSVPDASVVHPSTIIESADCEFHGCKTITDQTKCESLASSLLSFDPKFATSVSQTSRDKENPPRGYESRPKGCFSADYSSYNRLHFMNLNSGACSPKYRCLCEC